MVDRLVRVSGITELRQPKLTDLVRGYGRQEYSLYQSIALGTIELWLNVLNRVSQRDTFRITGMNAHSYLGEWIERFMRMGGLEKVKPNDGKRDGNLLLIPDYEFSWKKGTSFIKLPQARIAVYSETNEIGTRKFKPASDTAALAWPDQPAVEIFSDGPMYGLPNLQLHGQRLISAINEGVAWVELTPTTDTKSVDVSSVDGVDYAYRF